MLYRVFGFIRFRISSSEAPRSIRIVLGGCIVPLEDTNPGSCRSIVLSCAGSQRFGSTRRKTAFSCWHKSSTAGHSLAQSPLPTGPIASVFAYFYELSYVVIIIFAISSSLGFTAIQYLLRRINYQPKNLKILKKVERWQGRVTILIENFGYFIVLVMTATTLVLPLSISFLFHKNINYFKYFFYSLIGKILIFTVYFQMFRVTNLNYQIIGFY